MNQISMALECHIDRSCHTDIEVFGLGLQRESGVLCQICEGA